MQFRIYIQTYIYITEYFHAMVNAVISSINTLILDINWFSNGFRTLTICVKLSDHTLINDESNLYTTKILWIKNCIICSVTPRTNQFIYQHNKHVILLTIVLQIFLVQQLIRKKTKLIFCLI